MISNELLLLKIIESGGRLTLLCDRGLSHSQVALLIKKQESDGNIMITENTVSLTAKGKELLSSGFNKITHIRKNSWIVSQDHKYKKPIGFDEIILPKKMKI